jgi:predicted permease
MSWRKFFRRKQWDRDRFQEIEEHIVFAIDENIARGMSLEEARRQAYLQFGNPQKFREEIYRMNSFSAFENLLRDLRYAGRTLLRNPGYAILAVLTLGLGIGANTAIFTVINGVLLRPLPYAQENRILHIDQTVPRLGADPIGLSVQEYKDYQSQSTSFSDFAEYHSMLFTLLGTKNPERVVTGVVSSGFFDVLGVRPVLGRTFLPSDEKPDAAPVLLLSHAFWMKELGGDPHVIGRSFEMNDRVHTVIGVLPPLPDYPDNNDLFMPISSCPYRMDPMMIRDRDMRMITSYARLKPGVTPRQAQTELNAINARMAAAWPDSYSGWTGFSAVAIPVKHELTHAARPTFLALLGASVLVLLLACANLANLALSRQLRRSREIAIRLATGASTGRVVRQLLTESILVALCGAVLGLAIAAIGSRLLVDYAARLTPLASGIRIDGWVLAFGLGSAIVSGVLFAVLPAILATRTRLASLHDGGERTVGAATGARTRTALVALQVMLSFVLLTCAGLMMRSLYNLLSIDPGFRPANVLSMQLSLNWTKYKKDTDRASLFHQILGRTQGLPGVQSASVSWMAPLNPNMSVFNGPIQIDGRTQPSGTPNPVVDFETTSPDYFRVLAIPLLSGRAFTDADSADAPLTVIVNARMARHFWPGENPIGHRLKGGNSGKWWTVVGVVGDVHQYGLDKPPDDTTYIPLDQNPINNAHLLVRTRGNPLLLANAIATVVHQIDPQQPVTQVRTLDQMRSEQLGTPRVTATLLTLFAAVALFITIVGVSGTVALSVSRRSREIGIRIALGATRRNILQNVLGHGLSPVVAGLILGALASFFATRAMTDMIYGLKPDDPMTFASIAALFFAIALFSCAIPARRAMTIDPMNTLRSE